MREMDPKYIFFLHWSWIVPQEITDEFECVCFHMTDVPYGRGGSPLQNLIARGHSETKLTALRMTEDVDAGPVYYKRSLSLSGCAQDVYIRASSIAASMIQDIIAREPEPAPQTGEVVMFTKRTPAQSRASDVSALNDLYDFIRMLDAEGYPHAFFEHQGFRLEFTEAEKTDNMLTATVQVRKSEEVEN